MQIRNRTIVLTGATGGIGEHLAHAFAQAGARLILTGRHAHQLESLKSQLPKAHQPHVCVAADLLREQGRQRLVGVCTQHEVDMLVNNAGVTDFSFLEDTQEDFINTQIMLNLQVPILLTRRLLPQLLLRQRAAVINVGAVHDSVGYPGFTILSASKFGLRGFSEALRRELADSAVRVLHVAPRATHTALNSIPMIAMNHAFGNAIDAPAQVADFIVRRVLEGRWGYSGIGWPERFCNVLNTLFPSLIDRALHRRLPAARRFASANAETFTPTISHPSLSHSFSRQD